MMNISQRHGSAPTDGKVTAFASLRRSVADLDRAVDFYVKALGFHCTRTECDPKTTERTAELCLGDERIELHQLSEPACHALGKTERGIANCGFQHIAIVAADIDAAMNRLLRFAPEPISRGAAVQLPRRSGGVTAYKFRDPDGHPLELIAFPASTGDPKWRSRSATQPTIGIDHSAISISNIEQSIGFYTDRLGFNLASRQVNTGPEQDMLDGCRNVVVHVMGFAPGCVATPHLELLGYQHPAPVRMQCAGGVLETGADQLTWWVDDLDAIMIKLAACTAGHGAHSAIVDPDGLLVLDPDGHQMLLRQA